METIVKKYIQAHHSFTTKEFAGMLRVESPAMGRSTVYHILNLLCESGEIIRTSKGHYDTARKKDYFYELSDMAKEISTAIKKVYPLVDFQIWELYQMNEFVNHQLAKNVVFVEVEADLDETIFYYLFEKYPHVLHAPNVDEYYKYAGDITIIVKKLISEAPAGFGKYDQASLEKLLVDLFGRGVSGAIISRSEYRSIYEDAFRKYNINLVKMFRYARRRGIEKVIQEFICEETSIPLEAANARQKEL